MLFGMYFRICLHNYFINVSVRPPVQPMPRPVLPRERTLVDRFVDYLVGDGPSNRYALICRQCQSHNGMALKEEFEFIGNFVLLFLKMLLFR